LPPEFHDLELGFLTARKMGSKRYGNPRPGDVPTLVKEEAAPSHFFAAAALAPRRSSPELQDLELGAFIRSAGRDFFLV
jgi:hypothetical protein